VDTAKIIATESPMFIKILSADKRWALTNFPDPEGEFVDANKEYARLVREKKVDL
jgi:hypothetical protein